MKAMSENFKNIKIKHENGIWELILSRPAALNALNSQMLDELAEFLRQISEMNFEDARALIISGDGEKAFVAGADIKEISDLSQAQAFQFAVKGQSVFHELNLLKIPVIAAVNGFALGGGCELALACDFIVATKNSKFGLPEVSLGLIPGFGGTVRLARAVGLRKSRELVFSGEMIDADEAHRIGLVNHVVPTLTDLMPLVRKKLELILTRAPIAIANAKSSITQSWDMDMEQALRFEAEKFQNLFLTEDTREGTKAFMEKRKPVFKGN